MWRRSSASTRIDERAWIGVGKRHSVLTDDMSVNHPATVVNSCRFFRSGPTSLSFADASGSYGNRPRANDPWVLPKSVLPLTTSALLQGRLPPAPDRSNRRPTSRTCTSVFITNALRALFSLGVFAEAHPLGPVNMA